ncbi:putative non-structural protein [Trichinella pseudospiralis]
MFAPAILLLPAYFYFVSISNSQVFELCPSGSHLLSDSMGRPKRCLPHRTDLCNRDGLAPVDTCCYRAVGDYYCCAGVPEPLCPNYENYTSVIYKQLYATGSRKFPFRQALFNHRFGEYNNIIRNGDIFFDQFNHPDPNWQPATSSLNSDSGQTVFQTFGYGNAAPPFAPVSTTFFIPPSQNEAVNHRKRCEKKMSKSNMQAAISSCEIVNKTFTVKQPEYIQETEFIESNIKAETPYTEAVDKKEITESLKTPTPSSPTESTAYVNTPRPNYGEPTSNHLQSNYFSPITPNMYVGKPQPYKIIKPNASHNRNGYASGRRYGSTIQALPTLAVHRPPFQLKIPTRSSGPPGIQPSISSRLLKKSRNQSRLNNKKRLQPTNIAEALSLMEIRKQQQQQQPLMMSSTQPSWLKSNTVTNREMKKNQKKRLASVQPSVVELQLPKAYYQNLVPTEAI